MAIELNQQQINTLKRELPYFSPLRKALLAGDHQNTQLIIQSLMQPAQTPQYDASLAVKNAFVAFLLRVFCFVFAFLVKTPDTLSYRVLRSVLPEKTLKKANNEPIESPRQISVKTESTETQEPTAAAYKSVVKSAEKKIKLVDDIAEFTTQHLRLMDNEIPATSTQLQKAKEGLYHLAKEISAAIWERFFKPRYESYIVGSEASDIKNMVRLLAFINKHGNDTAKLQALLSLNPQKALTELDRKCPEVDHIIEEHRFIFIFMLASKMLQSYSLVTLSERPNTGNAFRYATKDDSQHQRWLRQLMEDFMGIPYQNSSRNHLGNKSYLKNVGSSPYLSQKILTVDTHDNIIDETYKLHGEKSPIEISPSAIVP